MNKRSKNIVNFTADELKAREQRGEDQTNLEMAARAGLPDGADPDDATEEVDWATAQLPMPRPKAHASLRLDADMLDWFKAPVAVIKRASMRCYAVTFSNRRGERIVPQRSFTRHIGESAPRA